MSILSTHTMVLSRYKNEEALVNYLFFELVKMCMQQRLFKTSD